jgi:oxalate decarboxylase
VLAKNFGVPVDAFRNIPLRNKWIYQSNQPAPPLETVQIAAAAGKPPNSFVFSLADMAPNQETKSGTVQTADSRNFLVSKTIAASRVTVKPGGLREMHCREHGRHGPRLHGGLPGGPVRGGLAVRLAGA